MADQPPLQALGWHLRDRRMLLLLDNFEQVDAAAPVVGRLLSEAAGLSVLVTSRSLLRLYGEHEFPVPQLTLERRGCPAVRRAGPGGRSVVPAHRRKRGDRTRDLCPAGLPPAGDRAGRSQGPRAAARTIVAGLPARLELAASGPRDLATRQQSLRDAIGWSHDPPSPDQQRLFAALSVFAGGWTEEAAARVCGATADRLAALVACNLVRSRVEDAVVRYDMLETIREYAAERPGSDDPVRHEHAAYYLEFAEQAAEGLRGSEQQTWTARLDTERDNLRVALTYLQDATQSELRSGSRRRSASIGTASAPWVRGRPGWSRRLPPHRRLVAGLRAQALHLLGVLVSDQGDDTRALALCEASGELPREGDRAGLARSLNSQGGIARDLGDLAHAEQRYAESAELRLACSGTRRRPGRSCWATRPSSPWTGGTWSRPGRWARSA